MSYLYLDIETVPKDDTISPEDIRAAVPKTYKKEESIQKWIEDNKESVVAEIIKKRSLDFYQCKIVCLSFSFDGAKPESITGEERNILKIFQTKITEHLGRDNSISGISVVGHNIKGFDGPIIFLRAAKYRLQKIHDVFYFSKKNIQDTMEMGVYYSYGKRVSLDALCEFFDVETPKGDMDGSKVYAAYKEGRIEDIANYCNKDVEALIKVHETLKV